MPITNNDQRRLLEEAKELVRGGALIPPHLNYVQQLHRYEKQTQNAALSRLHGLRHGYAAERRDMLQAWSDHLDSLRTGGNVVAIKPSLLG